MKCPSPRPCSLSPSRRAYRYTCIVPKPLVEMQAWSSPWMHKRMLPLGRRQKRSYSPMSIVPRSSSEGEDTFPSLELYAESQVELYTSKLRVTSLYCLGRADSPPTLSKSCSDKIALKQCTSLLSSPASLLVSPENAYITSLILPEPQYVPSACERAFSADGRMKDLSGRSWPGGYSFRPFEVLPTSVHFENSKSNSGSRSTNVSGAWTPHMRETLINGVLQGRKQSDPRGASIVSRQKMWATIAQIIKKLAYPPLTGLLKKGSYARLKQCKQLDDHRRVKEDAKALGLPGWVSNKVDDFELVHDTDQP
jgi:hypothetical protein